MVNEPTAVVVLRVTEHEADAVVNLKHESPLDICFNVGTVDEMVIDLLRKAQNKTVEEIQELSKGDAKHRFNTENPEDLKPLTAHAKVLRKLRDPVKDSPCPRLRYRDIVQLADTKRDVEAIFHLFLQHEPLCCA